MQNRMLRKKEIMKEGKGERRETEWVTGAEGDSELTREIQEEAGCGGIHL